MDNLTKEEILNTIRKEHKLALGSKDPMFALVTANEIVLNKQLEHINNIFSDQLIEIESVTKHYLNNAKEVLEKRLTLALEESKKQLEVKPPIQVEKEQNSTSLTTYLLFTITGIIIGYTLALFIL